MGWFEEREKSYRSGGLGGGDRCSRCHSSNTRTDRCTSVKYIGGDIVDINIKICNDCGHTWERL